MVLLNKNLTLRSETGLPDCVTIDATESIAHVVDAILGKCQLETTNDVWLQA